MKARRVREKQAVAQIESDTISRPGIANVPQWYIIDSRWMQSWIAFRDGKGGMCTRLSYSHVSPRAQTDGQPPGAIDNAVLLTADRRTPRESLQPGSFFALRDLVKRRHLTCTQ
jgi:hypothetical protein